MVATEKLRLFVESLLILSLSIFHFVCLGQNMNVIEYVTVKRNCIFSDYESF